MVKSDFYYDLPEELIAQTPIDRREGSRLLCMDRKTGELRHDYFSMLPDLLRDGDCLVLNDSRVMPARLLGRRETGGAAQALLLRAMPDLGDDVWECLTKPGSKTRPGTRLVFGDGELTATVEAVTDSGNRLIRFACEPPQTVPALFEKLGKMPLPPYIHEELEDSERYQTVYSRVTGSAAAPTAGLHFTNELLDLIRARGVRVCFVTLHVGLGTFRPVKADIIEDHKMHTEFFIIPEETAAAVNEAKSKGGRVIAVGTTSCRALEAGAIYTEGRKTVARGADDRLIQGFIGKFSGFTDIFIYPGYEFRCVDGLITNFHLPESTLIMLVSAFAGRRNIMNAYEAAIQKRYRFFSFGDAMFIC